MSLRKFLSAPFLASVTALTITLGLVSPAKADNQIPYFGAEFYSNPALKDEQLINVLSKILNYKHQIVPGKPDRIVSSCDSNSRCYSQTSLGYGGVKSFLLSKYYLIPTATGFSIKDVYCEKEYPAPGPHAVPNSAILNIEHTWPQSRFTGTFPKEMQRSDAHHLFPTDSEINSVRGNFPFGEVDQDQKNLKCRTSRFGRAKNGGQIVFEPPPQHRGNVARALFYFSVRYHMAIDEKQEAFLREWHKSDPVDQEEINRNNEIFRVQRNRNPFVDMPYLVDQIHNF